MIMEDLLNKRVPLAILAALLLQAGTAIWWAAATDAEARFQQERTAHLEQASERAADGQTRLLDRLARIEERVNAENQSLERIEKQLGTR